MKALIVEDEGEVARSVQRSLSALGLSATIAETVFDARTLLDQVQYAIVLLDRRLPDGDGLSLIPYARDRVADVPILVLSAVDHLEGRIAGLNAGSDDYLTKPFDRGELAARIRALLRRPGMGAGVKIEVGRVSLDSWRRIVTVDGEPMVMAGRELSLIEALLMRGRRVVTRDHLHGAVYGTEVDIASNALDALVSRLRKRLTDCNAGVEIVAVRGVGYMMTDA